VPTCPLLIKMTLSFNKTVSVLIVVVVPITVKLPPIDKLLEIVTLDTFRLLNETFELTRLQNDALGALIESCNVMFEAAKLYTIAFELVMLQSDAFTEVIVSTELIFEADR
jgi:hypothetical protein